MSSFSTEDVESKIFFCVQKLVDIIVQSRSCLPVTTLFEKAADNGVVVEYIKQATKPWKYDLYSNLSLEVIIPILTNSPERKYQFLVLEKWHFSCLRSGGYELSNGRSTLSRRIGILIRTLYSYVRLLPFFLGASASAFPSSSDVKFRLCCADSEESFDMKSLGPGMIREYKFPRMPISPVGQLSVKVEYVDSEGLQVLSRSFPALQALLQRIPFVHGSRSKLKSAPLPIPAPSTSNSEDSIDRSDRAEGSSLSREQSIRQHGQSFEQNDLPDAAAAEAGKFQPMSFDSDTKMSHDNTRLPDRDERRSRIYSFSYSDSGGSSLSPPGSTPPFSADQNYLANFERTMERRSQRSDSIGSVGSLLGDGRINASPPFPSSSMQLISTSPQFSSAFDLNIMRNRLVNQISPLNPSLPTGSYPANDHQLLKVVQHPNKVQIPLTLLEQGSNSATFDRGNLLPSLSVSPFDASFSPYLSSHPFAGTKNGDNVTSLLSSPTSKSKDGSAFSSPFTPLRTIGLFQEAGDVIKSPWREQKDFNKTENGDGSSTNSSVCGLSDDEGIFGLDEDMAFACTTQPDDAVSASIPSVACDSDTAAYNSRPRESSIDNVQRALFEISDFHKSRNVESTLTFASLAYHDQLVNPPMLKSFQEISPNLLVEHENSKGIQEAFSLLKEFREFQSAISN